MRKTVLFVALCLAGWSANAQSPGSALSIDANANRHAISPDIYGINFYWTLPASTDPAFPAALAAAQGIRATARRWAATIPAPITGSSTSPTSTTTGTTRCCQVTLYAVAVDGQRG